VIVVAILLIMMVEFLGGITVVLVSSGPNLAVSAKSGSSPDIDGYFVSRKGG